MSKPLLPDANVLLALAWPNHQFHRAARTALALRHQPWATCAITQLGFIRLSSNPAVTTAAKRPAEAAQLLARLTADAAHIYFDSLSAPAADGQAGVFAQILGHQQVTDAYLVSLAAQKNAVLLTFDTRLGNLTGHGGTVRILQ